MPEDKAVALADKLTRGQWTHDYPITAEEAVELGLPVSTGLPEEVADLMALYPQPVRTTPTVEYVPAPVPRQPRRSEEHTSELQSLMRISYAVSCLKKKMTN